jgi:tRNA A37 threonylcarbamoyltransferase TsaD
VQATLGPVLGIETSCDETAAAIVRLRPGQAPEILSDVIWGQVEEHTPFGGTTPRGRMSRRWTSPSPRRSGTQA